MKLIQTWNEGDSFAMNPQFPVSPLSPLLALSELPLSSPFRLFCVCVGVVCVSVSLMHNKVQLKYE
jgi:hypothetical protein